MIPRAEVMVWLKANGQNHVEPTEMFDPDNRAMVGGIWTDADNGEGLFGEQFYVREDVAYYLLEAGWEVEWFDLATVLLWPRKP